MHCVVKCADRLHGRGNDNVTSGLWANLADFTRKPVTLGHDI